MNKKTFDNLEDLELFVKELTKEKTFVLDIQELSSNHFILQWIEQKYYVAEDGKTFPDEVWITKDGDMFHVQDLSEAHVKNILRRILRRNREYTSVLEDLYKALSAEEYVEDELDEELGDELPPPSAMIH